MGPSFLFFVFPLIFWVLWFIYDWQGVSSFAMLGALPYNRKSPSLSKSVFGKKERGMC
jgi:hypothetical protein